MSSLRYLYTEHSLHELYCFSLFAVDIYAPALFVGDGQEHDTVMLSLDSAVYVSVAEFVYFKLFVCKSGISLLKNVTVHSVNHKLVVA